MQVSIFRKCAIIVLHISVFFYNVKCKTESCECRSNFVKEHTMCLYQPMYCNGNSSLIVDNAPLTCEEKKLILDEHNKRRSKLALGLVPGFPPAKDMMRMVYRDEASEICQCWLEQCKLSHDRKRDLPGYPCSGQNLHFIMRSTSYNDVGKNCEFNIPQIVEDWWKELELFDSKNINPFKATLTTSGTFLHFTQMAWANSWIMGCAKICYRDENDPTTYTRAIGCNYAPCGNRLRRVMYYEGQSNCAEFNLKKSKTPGLCERPDNALQDITGCPPSKTY